jgi:hypothetical protein
VLSVYSKLAIVEKSRVDKGLLSLSTALATSQSCAMWVSEDDLAFVCHDC